MYFLTKIKKKEKGYVAENGLLYRYSSLSKHTTFGFEKTHIISGVDIFQRWYTQQHHTFSN